MVINTIGAPRHKGRSALAGGRCSHPCIKKEPPCLGEHKLEQPTPDIILEGTIRDRSTYPARDLNLGTAPDYRPAPPCLHA